MESLSFPHLDHSLDTVTADRRWLPWRWFGPCLRLSQSASNRFHGNARFINRHDVKSPPPHLTSSQKLPGLKKPQENPSPPVTSSPPEPHAPDAPKAISFREYISGPLSEAVYWQERSRGRCSLWVN